ncbi:hypothetical protein [Dactylosporangium sp. NPDC048998]|uniref:hypothetical protein n=1 Tax=Dactylosporangium sp. NPDC048998 TaxID=3363976 RepID=UPI0037200BC5
MRRWLDSAAQAALCVLLATVATIALVTQAPPRLPPMAPETSAAPPGTRAMWLWRQDGHNR